MTKNIFGGQAVPEGVMFQNKEHMVTAIRRTDDSIDYFHMEKQPKKWVNTLKKIPIVPKEYEPKYKLIASISPTDTEIAQNKRSRSSHLRVIERR